MIKLIFGIIRSNPLNAHTKLIFNHGKKLEKDGTNFRFLFKMVLEPPPRSVRPPTIKFPLSATHYLYPRTKPNIVGLEDVC
jgi:hypothetical protein